MVRADCIQRHIQKSVMVSPRQRKMTQKYHSYSLRANCYDLLVTFLSTDYTLYSNSCNSTPTYSCIINTISHTELYSTNMIHFSYHLLAAV